MTRLCCSNKRVFHVDPRRLELVPLLTAPRPCTIWEIPHQALTSEPNGKRLPLGLAWSPSTHAMRSTWKAATCTRRLPGMSKRTARALRGA